MATFKEISAADVKTSRSYLSSLVDTLSEDISGSSTRRKYPVFVTGGIGPGVTSSLWHQIHDQDFTLQTSNPIFDMTVGLFYSGTTVQQSKTGEDSSGKLLFPSYSLMMREKVDIYKEMAQALLGNNTSQFVAPFSSTTTTDKISEAMFLCFKRLFHRDGIKRETFAMKFFQSASHNTAGETGSGASTKKPNLSKTSESGSAIYTDVGSAVNKEIAFGGQVSNIVDSSNTNRTVGLMFNDRGIAVFDLAKILSGGQHVSGVIDAMNDVTLPNGVGRGKMIIGRKGSGNEHAKFIPDFLVSASIDNIVDHLAACRFSSGSTTALTFQNVTNINSTLIFCNLDADEFNYSSNPTFIDSNNRIVVIDEGQEDTQQTFVFLTSIGLFDSNNNLLAVGSFSRPLEKGPEKSLVVRLRIDF